MDVYTPAIADIRRFAPICIYGGSGYNSKAWAVVDLSSRDRDRVEQVDAAYQTVLRRRGGRLQKPGLDSFGQAGQKVAEGFNSKPKKRSNEA
ncbi:unnamed protein product [Ceratitis capitata]|uniref:(Mediterranean fruit fly) hypothetical protein n=1 Tax=Ceratitis capitata TaxID=7213 RepID=A0A811UI79_CERCA|nr:unnamed protein product [Ceratitis capitata]